MSVGWAPGSGSGELRRLLGTLLWWVEARVAGGLRRGDGDRFRVFDEKVLIVRGLVGFLVFVGPVCSWSLTQVGAIVVGVLEVGAGEVEGHGQGEDP